MASPEPDLRILQANERTLLAWIRTGLALMAFGFVISRLAVWLRLEHPEYDESGSTRLGISVLASGILCQALGAVRFVRARRAIIEGRTIAPSALGPVALAAFVAAIGIATVVYLGTAR